MSAVRVPLPGSRGRPTSFLAVAGLTAYALAVGTYFVARTGGLFADTDTSLLTRVARSMSDDGRLIPESGYVYANGYGYPLLLVVGAQMSGLSIAFIQQVVGPLAAALLILPAWVLYRELTGSARAATLATLILFVQPELLFVLLRGSHERLLRSLMLVALWLLVRSARLRDRPAALAAHVGLFYFVAYALIATNALFGISFLTAIFLALVVAWIVGRLPVGAFGDASRLAGRLAWVTLAVTCLGFVFVFYLYAPAGAGVQLLGTIPKKLAALFLTTSEQAANPYGAVSRGWISVPVYFLLSTATYLLMISSAVVWMHQGLTWVRRRGAQPAPGPLLGWLFFAGFASQGVLAAIGDVTGMLGGNLQHRSFPSFAIAASPLVADVLSRARPPALGRLLPGAGLAVLAGFAILKATNEPTLSNKWTLYTPSELQSLAWVREHMSYETVWVGLDERLATAAEIGLQGDSGTVEWNIYTPSPGTRLFLVSDLIRLQSARFEQPMPPLDGANRLYDRGDVQLYALPARTAYQR